MKAICVFFSFLLFLSMNAQAEHDATYCGIPSKSNHISDDSGNDLVGAIIVRYHVAVDPWSNREAVSMAFAGLSDLKLNEQMILNVAKNTRKKICVTGTWSGSLSKSKKVKSISLTSVAIKELNYLEKTKIKQLAYVIGL